MLKVRPYLSLAVCFLLSVMLTFPPRALAQKQDRFRIDYTVAVASIDEQRFHVTADVQGISEPVLELSLPVWTPGWYTIENYLKNVLRLTISDARGNRLPFTMPRKQTWRVQTKGVDRIKIEFDYLAHVLALNQAKISSDFAFFTGTEIFIGAANHRATPSKVSFVAPPGWKIISALKQLDETTFSATDYDNLLDSPTEMGNFDVTKFEVDGKPHYLVTNPLGVFSQEKAARFTEMLTKVAKTDGAIFGGLPYEKYIYFYFFTRAESNAGGALEHNNSFVAFAPAGQLATPEFIVGTAAHEFFHLWNVKRIRPLEMWPYDYSRENESPLLWVSEGFTNYYGNLALYRAGLRTRKQFLNSVAGAINGVEDSEARKYISPANSSASTWVGYDTPVAFGISYYTQGQNLGALLDLSILHDTAGAARLDDVMRALFHDFYEKGKGFTTEDMIGIINRLTKGDYHDFYRKYVWGVDVPPYDTILGYAGFKMETGDQKSAHLGLALNNASEGLVVSGVAPGGPAANGGFQVGDIILSFDGLDAKNVEKIGDRIDEKVDQAVKVVVKRGDKTQTLDLTIGSQLEKSRKLIELPNPGADQIKVRDAWLKQ
jgi:predicted metalloprotease with PDZ domain